MRVEVTREREAARNKAVRVPTRVPLLGRAAYSTLLCLGERGKQQKAVSWGEMGDTRWYTRKCDDEYTLEALR